MADNSGEYSADYWVDTTVVYSVGHLAVHSVEKKAVTKADNSVARWVATTDVTKGSDLAGQKVAKRAAMKAEHWVVQSAAYSVETKVVQKAVN